MTPREREMVRAILVELGEDSLRAVRSRVGSKTLRAALHLVLDESELRAALFIPHYWAIYYHDGRGAISPVNARKLVFFDDPRDDPRIQAGYPERSSQIRRLTKRQYERGLEINRERFAKGERPFMFVVDRVGPQGGQPFFDELAVGAAGRAAPTVLRIFDAYMQEQVDTEDALRPERGDASFEL